MAKGFKVAVSGNGLNSVNIDSVCVKFVNKTAPGTVGADAQSIKPSFFYS